MRQYPINLFQMNWIGLLLSDHNIFDKSIAQKDKRKKDTFMSQTIQYAVDIETGMVISRIGSEIAIPVLQFDKMLPENNFQTIYELEKMDVSAISHCWFQYKWTRKIPMKLKNRHRIFWGLNLLK